MHCLEHVNVFPLSRRVDFSGRGSYLSCWYVTITGKYNEYIFCRTSDKCNTRREYELVLART